MTPEDLQNVDVGPDCTGCTPMDVENDEQCWICLASQEDDLLQTLMAACRCPRKVHPRCLARWQLQQAGRPEETHCRFCNSTLADWKKCLTPENLRPDVQKVQPIMVVYFEGEIHRIPVKQGSDGLKEFTTRIRELFRLPEDVDISLTFGCKEPLSGQHLKLEGIGAFDAAVHCASVAAAERQQKMKSGPNSAAGSPAGSAGGALPSPSSGGGALQGRSSSRRVPPAMAAAGSSPQVPLNAPASPATPPASHPSSPPPALDPLAANQLPGHYQQPALQPVPLPAINTRRATSSSAASYGALMPASSLSEALAPVTPPAAATFCRGQHFQSLSHTSPQIQEASSPSPSYTSASPSVSSRSASTGTVPFEALEGMNSVNSANSVTSDRASPLRRRISARVRDAALESASSMDTDDLSSQGSLTGRLKFTLKAFSRKVARSLNLKQADVQGATELVQPGPVQESS